ncbi:hypothetical protein B0O99DRAFT_617641 [Bisporella sp. PMI_857]|nr:hypothetical protein B0O99DRAFT_617641 [Bisporella sp. PMI_857]
MRVFLALSFFLWGMNAQLADPCPKDEYACLDVIDSSLCLSSNAAAGNATILAKCVSYEGAASDLPGSVKVRLPSIF